MIWLQELKRLFAKQLQVDKHKSTWTKWKQSLLAIIIALVLSSILILSQNENPLTVFADIINGATKNKNSWDTTLIYFSMFLLAGMAIIVGFKCGLFNIGIPGQILLSGSLMMVIAVKTSLPWIVLLILAMLFAAAAASLAGVLKSLFNIHEVVSTILLNWIFFWISQYLLSTKHAWTNENGSTLELDPASKMSINGSPIIPALIITGVLLMAILILFNFTKWGFALKATGQNPNAAKYAGVKVTVQLAFGMALSGMIAGALASVDYLGHYSSMSQATGKILPDIGFQGISVALIAFNNFLGLIPAAFFWAVITSGSNYASIVHPDVPKEILALMNGLIIYMIAISIIFIRFRPFNLLWKVYLHSRSEEIKTAKMKKKKAKTQQHLLFNESKEKHILSLDPKNTKLELKKIRQKKWGLQKQIWLQKFKYHLRNKRPWPLKFNKITNWKKLEQWKNLFRNNDYASDLTKYYLALQNELSTLNNEFNKLNQNQITLIKNSQKMQLKNHKKQLKIALSIVDNEHQRRVKILESDLTKKTWVGKINQYLKQKKLQENLYDEKYGLLKLNYLQELRLVKNNKVEKQKLKTNFLAASKKLEQEIFASNQQAKEAK